MIANGDGAPRGGRGPFVVSRISVAGHPRNNTALPLRPSLTFAHRIRWREGIEAGDETGARAVHLGYDPPVTGP